MTDFGFSLTKSSSINLDKVDTSIYYRLCEAVPAVKSCMNCGSCTASCTAGPYSGMSVRKTLLALQRGSDIKQMISGCMLCGKCTMVCPRGINTRLLVLTLCKIYDR